MKRLFFCPSTSQSQIDSENGVSGVGGGGWWSDILSIRAVVVDSSNNFF